MNASVENNPQVVTAKFNWKTETADSTYIYMYAQLGPINTSLELRKKSKFN